MFEWILNGGGVPVVVGEYVFGSRLTSDDVDFGYSVTTSGDGLTLAVGAAVGKSCTVYTRATVGESFTQLQREVSTDVNYGRSVILSSDGLTLAVGAFGSNAYTLYYQYR